jgi:alkanesulfonate monooxygenase SsuD/methylene tetrahydromethanopterin reductase-like flavin-dependent oxidoreductase (luciferase family)
MEIGVGLPATIPGASGPLVLEWARRTDSGPFSSLGVIDRLVYTNHEILISLAGAAAVTERVRLMTTVLIAPVRDAALLAKQAATIDAFSGGRLTLGLGVGARDDDFRAASATFEDRGRRFEEQLDLMKRVWSGEPVGDGIGEIGPQPAQPGGPELLIGAYAPAPLKRVGRWGDGFISGGIPDPPTVRQMYEVAEESWRAEGREGRPRFVACMYYALGSDAERGGDYIRDYYSYFGGAEEDMANSIPSSRETVEGLIKGFADAGVDELMCWPTIPDLDQLDRLAELVG